jgi:large subunit ribosomal protein L28
MFVTLNVSTAAIRTIDKLGLDTFARKNGVKL